MQDDQKSLVQRQFGVAAEDYAVSDIHASGESLQILLTWIQPQSEWTVLDVATGAGHTAITFAPAVARVVATDITQPMLDKTRQLAKERELSNVETIFAEAESLPFEDNSFDLVTCRLAMHHFSDPDQALSEMARVLRPNGKLGFTDNVTVEDEEAAQIYNDYEKLRDPSHRHVGSFKQLQQQIVNAGFQIDRTKVSTKEFEFHDWANRQRVSDSNKTRLNEIMKSIPSELSVLFSPRWESKTMYFSLWEAIVLGTKT